MPINIPRGKKDKVIEKIVRVLKTYEKENPEAQIDIYRQSPVSIRVRIIDPSLHGMDKSARHEKAWHFLGQLPDEVQGDISMLVLLAPNETAASFGNLEFNDPVPSNF